MFYDAIHYVIPRPLHALRAHRTNMYGCAEAQEADNAEQELLWCDLPLLGAAAYGKNMR